MQTHDDLLEYYRRELSYLRTQGSDFAARHPQVARHLVPDSGAADPHTRHLVESVAFLTARIHQDLDRELPAVASATLDALCPNLTQPVPAMTVVQMTLDPSDGKVTAGMPVRRGTMLTASAATANSGETCRFECAWNSTLWPLRVARVVQEDPRSLRIDVETEGGIDVGELELDSLRVHLAGDLLCTMPLHELLLGALLHVEVQGAGGVHRLDAAQLVQAGFAAQEMVLARPGNAQPAYALLQEYFAFPRKFQFFDLRGLRGRLGHGPGFSLRLVFAHGAPVLGNLCATDLRLNCVPVVNLFPLTAEPIAYDRRHYEYLLIPDRRRDTVTEVHSVVSVSVSEPDGERSRPVPNAYGDDAGAQPALGWTTRREASLRPGIHGSDMFLALVERGDVHSGMHAGARDQVLHVRLLCTNRGLADRVIPGTRLHGDGIAASTTIRALYQPSAARAPAAASAALWSLVALTRLNHHTLVSAADGAGTLRKMLRLFAANARDQAQIAALRSVHATPALARLGVDSWRGHCRGTDVALEFDTEAFAGGSPLLLGAVLAHFFALYTTANAFVRLSVLRRGEVWKQWPPMAGRQCLI